jgi:DNA end-binding protein Ku
MTRGIWNGNISFGLVNIPVSLRSAETHDKVHFHMLDKKDKAPIKYRTINGATQKEIRRDQIVKGYEYKKDQFVLMTNEDFKNANVKSTKTIDLQAFVNIQEVPVEFFEKPYFIEPSAKALKSYALLREALRGSKKVGIAKVVLSNKQHLCAVMVRGDYLILEVLRFAHELVSPDKKIVPTSNLKKLGIKEAEVKMAAQLISQMTEKFKPTQYKDEYQDDLLKFIQNKIKRGAHFKVIAPAEQKESTQAQEGKVIDFMSLLKKSMNKADRRQKSSKSV